MPKKKGTSGATPTLDWEAESSDALNTHFLCKSSRILHMQMTWYKMINMQEGHCESVDLQQGR